MRDELPRGTVTFLFTDVEGSTRLLDELGAERYAAALADHRRVVREACAANEGVEVDTQGDAFLVAFSTAPGALAAAARLTEELEPSPVRVRIGVHTGTPLVTGEGYVGADVHRAARIAASGHGGQVLVSDSTASLVDRNLLRDLGEHRLKDLSAPERIYQLGDGGFPPLTSLHHTNLPVPATPFLGREKELAEVGGLLSRSDVRLLTLTGPGGTGKTRLAAQAAGMSAGEYPDGIWWVPLDTLRDATLVLESAAQVLGAKRELRAHVGDKRMLILFDCFERVLDGAGGVADLQSGCPNLKLLVTSRERLHLTGEQEYAVPPFAHQEAVGFFSARARAAKHNFEADATVSEICRRLDDIPLALELAAARVKVLSTRQILERGLPLSTPGPRDLPDRQRTLRATIEWSYELLTEEERQLFRRLAVFAGGCTLEAAEEVTEADVETLQSLVDKSLLRSSNERYGMLETIREFGAELLVESSEDELLRDRHLAFYLALVEEIEPRLTGPEQRQWFERLAREQENVRGALTFACDRGDGERALMLAGTIWRFWWTHGPVAEASRWYERAFALAASTSDRARARGLFGAAHMAEALGKTAQARTQYEQAADLLRRIGETRWLILALTHLAGTYDADSERAESTQIEALTLAEASGDRRGAAIVKGNLASIRLAKGDNEQAEELLAEALEGHRALGDVYGIAACLSSLAKLALRHGDVEAAVSNVRESLALSHSIGDVLSLAEALSIAAATVLARGDPQTAARLCAADDALCSAHGFDPASMLDATARAAREAMNDGFDEVWAAGANLDLEAAVELAFSALD